MSQPLTLAADQCKKWSSGILIPYLTAKGLFYIVLTMEPTGSDPIHGSATIVLLQVQILSRVPRFDFVYTRYDVLSVVNIEK